MIFDSSRDLEKEFVMRFHNILSTPKFDRRLDKRSNHYRKDVIKKKGNICFNCGTVLEEKDICVSHILPVELFPDYAFELWNGLVKCRACNLKDGCYQFRKMKKEENNARELVRKARNYFATRVY